jgi:hypothetical protein
MPKLEQVIADLVALDGLPRQAIDETGAVHVLFLDGAVRSVEAGAWPPPLPTEPTPEQSAAAIQARAATEEAERQAIQALRQQVLTILDPLTGQLASAPLTLAQAQAFIKALIYERGGINPATGRYRDPRDWLRD